MKELNPRKLLTPKAWSTLPHAKKVWYTRTAKRGLFAFKMRYTTEAQ